MSTKPPLRVYTFYRYGYRGRDMAAVRAPFAMPADAAPIIGREVWIDEKTYRVKAVARQISGPIAEGEPIGLEIEPWERGDSNESEHPGQ
jgi:hypothetical protein